jgi:antitoxin (DNA-binding transcriptional repressor) of toxin-antitoxin stability system
LDVKAAEKDLDALLDRACSGEDIVIDIQGVPRVPLVSVDGHSPQPEHATKRTDHARRPPEDHPAPPPAVHPSDSAEQRAIEPVVLEEISKRVGIPLEPRTFELPNGARMDLDGASADGSVLVEIFAHQGALKGGQVHKVARDALKLITLQRTHMGAQLILGFADDRTATSVTGKSWLAEALRSWKIEVLIIELDEMQKKLLRDAQARQLMQNPIQ